MAAVDPESLVMIGRIYRAHGIKGELKVIPETDDPEHFQNLETVYTGPDAQNVVTRTLESVRFQQTKRGVTIIVRLDSIVDRDVAERLRKQHVYAREQDLNIEDDDVFIDDLIGMHVQTVDGASVGEVIEVIQTPAHHVYVVERSDAPDALIPHVPEFIVEIDEEARCIIIDPIEGLLD